MIKELFDDHPPLQIDPAEYLRLLGYPIGHQWSNRAKELADMTADWYQQHGKPWIYLRKANQFELQDDQFILDKVDFRSKAVIDRFQKGVAHDVYLVAVSAGKECEMRAQELYKEGKPDEYFFMEMYGSAVVENLVMQTSGRLCALADENNLAILPHYSPGYREWDIREQLKLIQLIKEGNTAKNDLLVESLDSGMLKPKKSLLAIFGVTSQPSKLTAYPSMVPCQKCALKGCNYRRKPYRFSKESPSDTNQKNNQERMKKEWNYTLKEKVLQKWTEQRLKISANGNDGLNALFLYDGTTCSSIGFPIKFEYSINLNSHNSQFTITALDCQPIAGDMGHKKMCQYIKQGEKILEEVRESPELIGKTLDELVEREVSYFPSGCYCDKNGRDYKWHQVIQVLHFALNREEFIAKKLDNLALNG